MPTWTATLDVSTPCERVFTYLSDVASVVEWEHTGMIVGARLVGADPIGPGREAVQTMSMLGRREVPLKVVEFEQNRRIRFEKTWPFYVAYGWRLTPIEGGTRIDYDVEMQLTGPIGFITRVTMGQKGVQKALATDLANIQRHLAAQ
jgi:hypothetical protein